MLNRRIIALAVALLIIFPSFGLRAKFPDYEMDDWKHWFHNCGYGAQAVEAVPELELAEEYRHLKQKMLENAGQLGASPEQLVILSESFDSGRRQAFQEGWNDQKEIPKDDEEGLADARKGMLENRNFCVKYGK